MWRELRAQRPRLRVADPPLWVGPHQPCKQPLDGLLHRTICLRTCSCHRLHETMHRHRRYAILERMVLDERNFDERSERLQALRLVVNRALDQCHWNAFRCALGQIRHERFGSWTLCHGLCDGEVEGRGDAPGITRATRRSINETRSLLC